MVCMIWEWSFSSARILSLMEGSIVWPKAEMASRQARAEMRSNLGIHFSGAVKDNGCDWKRKQFSGTLFYLVEIRQSASRKFPEAASLCLHPLGFLVGNG